MIISCGGKKYSGRILIQSYDSFESVGALLVLDHELAESAKTRLCKRSQYLLELNALLGLRFGFNGFGVVAFFRLRESYALTRRRAKPCGQLVTDERALPDTGTRLRSAYAGVR